MLLARFENAAHSVLKAICCSFLPFYLSEVVQLSAVPVLYPSCISVLIMLRAYIYKMSVVQTEAIDDTAPPTKLKLLQMQLLFRVLIHVLTVEPFFVIHSTLR